MSGINSYPPKITPSTTDKLLGVDSTNSSAKLFALADIKTLISPGTAASLDGGSAAGQVPILNSLGQLDPSLIPTTSSGGGSVVRGAPRKYGPSSHLFRIGTSFATAQSEIDKLYAAGTRSIRCEVSGSDGMSGIATLDSAYWSKADQVIAYMKTKGMSIVLSPMEVHSTHHTGGFYATAPTYQVRDRSGSGIGATFTCNGTFPGPVTSITKNAGGSAYGDPFGYFTGGGMTKQATATVTQTGGVCNTPTIGSTDKFVPPSDPSNYATFLTLIANRYYATYPDLIIELFNEPSLQPTSGSSGFYHIQNGLPSTANAALDYARVVQPCYAALKAAAPNWIVVSGSLHRNDQTFLQAVYSNVKTLYGTSAAWNDGIAVHPYNDIYDPIDPAHDASDRGHSFIYTFIDTWATMQANDPAFASKGVWGMEWGYATSGSLHNVGTDSVRQTYYQHALDLFEAVDSTGKSLYPYIKGLYLFTTFLAQADGFSHYTAPNFNASYIAYAARAATLLGPILSVGSSINSASGAGARHTATQSIGTAASTPLIFNTEDFDTGGYHYIDSLNITGTVSTTSGANGLTGSGTLFTTELNVGQLVRLNASSTHDYVIIAIASDTSATLNRVAAATLSAVNAQRRAGAFVARAAGLYQVMAWCEFPASATGVREIELRINGVAKAGLGPTPGSGTRVSRLSIAFQPTLAQWDFVEVWVYQDSGGALILNNSTTGMSMVYAGATS